MSTKLSASLGMLFLFVSMPFAQAGDCSSWSVTATGVWFTNSFCQSGSGGISAGPANSTNSVELNSVGNSVTAKVNQTLIPAPQDISAATLLSCAKILSSGSTGLNSDQRAQVLVTLDILNALKDPSSRVEPADVAQALFSICTN